MAEVVSIKGIGSIVKRLRKQQQVLVLAGGCFDLLHPGHVVFLEKAKEAGDILIVILESDEKVRILKGLNRPVRAQYERAEALSAVRSVDYIVTLPVMKNDSEYDQLIAKIKPEVIAISSKDKESAHHKRAARISGAKLKLVTKVIGGYSTTKLLNF